jgi:hypothetical protein
LPRALDVRSPRLAVWGCAFWDPYRVPEGAGDGRDRCALRWRVSPGSSGVDAQKLVGSFPHEAALYVPSLWERHAEEWTAELKLIAAESAGFRIAYERIVATDSSVVALAEPSEPVNHIRRMIRERLRLPLETRNEADRVHTTLFRYRGPLSDPEMFLALLGETSADATAGVEELVISRELVYPSLKAEVLGRLPLTSP